MIKFIAAAVLALAVAPPPSPRSTSTRPRRPSSKRVKGIGPGMPTRILDARKNGPFKDWADLQRPRQGRRATATRASSRRTA